LLNAFHVLEGSIFVPFEAMAATGIEPSGDGTAVGTSLYAALQSPDGTIERFRFDPAIGINYFLVPNTFYMLTVFDPSTLYVGVTELVSSALGFFDNYSRNWFGS
jgi:hypothetical protein